MLVTYFDILFAYDSGTETMEVTGTKIFFGLELEGHIDDMLDHSLTESYEDTRETLDIWVKLTATQSDWMADFLMADDKQITIDLTTYDVVNYSDKINFELFKNTTIGAFLKLKFLCKELGVLDPLTPIGQNDPNA